MTQSPGSFASVFRVYTVHDILHVRHNSITGPVSPMNHFERRCIMFELCAWPCVCRLSRCAKIPMFQNLPPVASTILKSTAPPPYWQDLSFTRCMPACLPSSCVVGLLPPLGYQLPIVSSVAHWNQMRGIFACAQVWNDKDEQDECLAMVVRTGLNSTVGNMMRPLLHSHWARQHLRSFMGFYRKVRHLPPAVPCCVHQSCWMLW